MDLPRLARWVSGGRQISEDKLKLPCRVPGHPDADAQLSVLARQTNGKLLVGCFGGLSHSREKVLEAYGLTTADLDCGRPAPQESPSLPPTAPAAAFSGNGTHSAPSKFKHAIAYARRGVTVFPCHNIDPDGYCSCGAKACKSAGKHPRWKGWQADSTTDEAQIRQWWLETPNANIGVACGEKSDLTVLDVDGDDGRETLRTLELEHGELPVTPMVITGRGGNHYYFCYESDLGNDVRFEGGFAGGLDIRTEGGLVVGVGSITQQLYRWEVSAKLGEVEVARMPRWLVDLIKAKHAPVNGKVVTVPAEPLTEGQGRNNLLYRLGRSQKAQNFPAPAIAASLNALNATFKPPLEKDEMGALIRNVCQSADRADFVLATTNGHMPAAEEPEIDREPMDAYEAYQIIQASPREYSWQGLIRYACTLVLTALMGAGKTTLLMNLVRCWALGIDFLGRTCKQSKSLVVVSPKEYEAWCDTIGFWGLRGAIFIIPSHKTHFESGAEQARWFETTMKRYDCQTFVLDTLFDFFGMPPNTRGDSNRIAMAEQTPLLDVIRANVWSGAVSGHAPKSEAQAVVPRDPEEAFGGHTAWTAQHRMRAVIRRKTKGASGQVSTFITGRGGFGDLGMLDESMLLFDAETRLVSLGGKFSEYLGETALPSVLEALAGGGWMGRSEMMKHTGKAKNWVYAGVKNGIKNDKIKWNRKGGRAAKYALPDEPDEAQQGDLAI